MKYNKDKHMLLQLKRLNKDDLKEIALAENRTVNNMVNVILEEYYDEWHKAKEQEKKVGEN